MPCGDGDMADLRHHAARSQCRGGGVAVADDEGCAGAIARMMVAELPVDMVEGELDADDIGVVQFDGRLSVRPGRIIGDVIPVEHRGVGHPEFLGPQVLRGAVRLDGAFQWHGQAQAGPSGVKTFEESIKVILPRLVLVIQPIIEIQRPVGRVMQYRRQRMRNRFAKYCAAMVGHIPSLNIFFHASRHLVVVLSRYAIRNRKFMPSGGTGSGKEIIATVYGKLSWAVAALAPRRRGAVAK